MSRCWKMDLRAILFKVEEGEVEEEEEEEEEDYWIYPCGID